MLLHLQSEITLNSQEVYTSHQYKIILSRTGWNYKLQKVLFSEIILYWLEVKSSLSVKIFWIKKPWTGRKYVFSSLCELKMPTSIYLTVVSILKQQKYSRTNVSIGLTLTNSFVLIRNNIFCVGLFMRQKSKKLLQ